MKQKKPGTDLRYKAMKVYIETGLVKSFKDIFKYIPKSVVRADFGFHHYRMKMFIDNPSSFQLKYINKLARYMGVETTALMDLIDGI